MKANREGKECFLILTTPSRRNRWGCSACFQKVASMQEFCVIDGKATSNDDSTGYAPCRFLRRRCRRTAPLEHQHDGFGISLDRRCSALRQQRVVVESGDIPADITRKAVAAIAKQFLAKVACTSETHPNHTLYLRQGSTERIRISV
jgi:hypothetical protein